VEAEHKIIIAAEFESCITRTIGRLESQETYRPFHTALLSSDALFWSRFERSFSTSFGQSVIEKISKVVVLANGATSATNQKATLFTLSSAQLMAINNHINGLREGRIGRGVDFESDLAVVVAEAGQSGDQEDVRVISDLWWLKDGINHYMSIKTVKPNIDQTAEAKRDLLKLRLYDPNCRVYFGLYYNPYGELRENYGWTPPQGVFNFRADPVVLIGRDYWNELGGLDCYDEVIAIAEECGKKTRLLVETLNR
jgi:hypothetical protein